MNIFFCFIMLLCCFFVFFKEKNDKITPAKLLVLLWTFIIILSSLNLNGLKKAVNEVYFMLLLMVICFLIGYMITRKITLAKNNNSKSKENIYEISYNIFFLLAILLFVINIIDCYMVIKHYINGIPMWQIRNWSLEPYGTNNPIIGRIGLFEKVLRSVILEPFNTILPAIVSYNFFSKEGKYKKSLIILSILILFTSSISGGGGRISFIIYTAFFALGYFLLNKKNIKVKKNLLLVGIIAVILMSILTVIRSGFGNIFNQFYRYFAMPPTLLSIHLNKIKNLPKTYGLLSFFGVHTYLFRGLKMLKLNFLVPVSYEHAYQSILNAEVFKNIGDGVGNAFVTPIYYFYIDGGYIAIIILSLFFGVITSLFYYKVISLKKLNIRSFCFYSLILYAIFISFMRIQTAIPGFIIAFLLIVVLTRKKEERDKMNNKIDFVVTWVDGNDKKWLEDKSKYQKTKKNEGNKNSRYRDWETLKYWFRSIEENANWCNKIYFITYGHIPKWLNTNNEKLVIVKHEDFIPKEYLPTFNSNVIEIFINRIKGLSENFVYFNDDTFILNKMDENEFFVDNLPCDSFSFNAVSSKKENNIVEHTILNNLEVIANYFSKKEVIKRNFFKIFNLKSGSSLIKSVCLVPWKNFTGIENHHMPMPYLKSTFDKIWNLESERLYDMSITKFRDKNDYSIWLMRYWQLCSGNFNTKSYKKTICYELKDNNSLEFKSIFSKKYNMVCLNDSNDNLNFNKVKKELLYYFEKKFPNKSSFEK